MPDNARERRGIAAVGAADFEASDLLREEVYLAGIAARETFEDFGECPLGAVMAVEEGGDNGETQGVTRFGRRLGMHFGRRLHRRIRT